MLSKTRSRITHPKITLISQHTELGSLTGYEFIVYFTGCPDIRRSSTTQSDFSLLNGCYCDECVTVTFDPTALLPILQSLSPLVMKQSYRAKIVMGHRFQIIINYLPQNHPDSL